MLHQIPFGGEDFHHYDGAARLVRATGEEHFDAVVNGEVTIEHPSPDEVIWRDDTGVTCRRWNWRQGRRTSLTDDTATAFFILDALAPATDGQIEAAADALTAALGQLGEVTVARRLIGAP